MFTSTFILLADVFYPKYHTNKAKHNPSIQLRVKGLAQAPNSDCLAELGFELTSGREPNWQIFFFFPFLSLHYMLLNCSISLVVHGVDKTSLLGD